MHTKLVTLFRIAALAVPLAVSACMTDDHMRSTSSGAEPAGASGGDHTGVLPSPIQATEKRQK
jgi:hypothetical protein